MMNNPQHACQSCNEFIGAVRGLKHEVSEAKRLGTAEQLQAFLTVLQVRLGGLETLAVEIKGFRWSGEPLQSRVNAPQAPSAIVNSEL